MDGSFIKIIQQVNASLQPDAFRVPHTLSFTLPWVISHTHAHTHTRAHWRKTSLSICHLQGVFFWFFLAFWLICCCFPVQQLIMSHFPPVWCIWYRISSCFKSVCWWICVSPLCCWLRAQPNGSCAVSLKLKYVHRKDGYTMMRVDRWKLCKQECRHVIEAIYCSRFDFCGQLMAPQRDFWWCSRYCLTVLIQTYINDVNNR